MFELNFIALQFPTVILFFSFFFFSPRTESGSGLEELIQHFNLLLQSHIPKTTRDRTLTVITEKVKLNDCSPWSQICHCLLQRLKKS